MASFVGSGFGELNNNLFKRSSQSSSTQSTSSSLSALIATLIPVLLISGVMTILFLVLRRSQRRMYAPRTYLGSLREQERSPDMPNGLFNWIKEFNSLPDSYVLNHQSIDGYLLLRYLKICTVICFVGCLITWPVLFPVNITGGGGQKQLNLLSFGNVTGNKYRYLAHTGIACIFVSFVMFMITRESLYYITLRQAYLLSPLYASRISSRTVLFASVPDEYLNEAKWHQMFGNKLKNLWIATDCKEIAEKVEERDKVAMKLEGAETKLTKLANAARLKAIQEGAHDEEAPGTDHAVEDDMDGESGSVAARWVKPKQRPTHRTKFLIGKKVDTINWSRSELERLIPEVDELQAKHQAGDAAYVSSVFVEFYSQAEAQAAYQMVAHHQPLHMAPRFIGLNPSQIVWENLQIKWHARVIRNFACIAFVCALIIFWAIPVSFVGILSNINALTNKVHFLKFINHIPKSILGVITGLLPSVLMAVLMALLPIVLRLMAKFSGMPSLAAIELRTQNFYFAFQVVQVFLVATLASAATSSVTKIIAKPSSATSLLAENIPKASNFYISYFVLQGLTFSSGALLQIVGLILFRVLGHFLDSTPRKMYKRWSTLSGLGWGTVFPIYANLCSIAIVYSCIAPLVLGFATIGLYLIYLAYRYNLLFVFNANIDTGGLVYPRALQHLTVGVYLLLICLIGLLAIKTAILALVLLILFTIFVMLYHVALNSALDPLLRYLPTSLVAEEEALLSIENGDTRDSSTPHKNGGSTSREGEVIEEKDKGLPSTPPMKKPGVFAKFLHPDKYCDYQTLRRLVPSGFADVVYSPEIEKNAYYHPAISSPTPLLWIPRDAGGVSRQEVMHTSRVIPITDDGAHFDEKNKIIWDQEGGHPPIFMEKIYY